MIMNTPKYKIASKNFDILPRGEPDDFSHMINLALEPQSEDVLAKRKESKYNQHMSPLFKLIC